MGVNKCFKAYDIRGSFPDQLNADFAFALGAALPQTFQAKKVVVGYDARLSGPILRDALFAGLKLSGAEPFSIGMCGTEEIYYASTQQEFDLGVMITGSHNPANENGFKIVRAGAIPVSSDSGLKELEKNTSIILVKGISASRDSKAEHCNFRDDYLRWLIAYSGLSKIKTSKKLKVLLNAGNGCAALVLNKICDFLPFEFVKLHFTPDGNFPNGVPNPLLMEKRQETSAAVLANNADLGIAFDGDFDRCFFFDGNGKFIESYYLIGLLASELLLTNPGEKIVHDTRVYWNTRELVLQYGGKPVMWKTGHAFMKEKMRAENALYGGEMSAHHYFRDFSYCDSGMLTMFLTLSFLCKSGESLSEILAKRMAAYPCSGEINFRVEDAAAIMEAIKNKYSQLAEYQDNIDGVNMEFTNWRFNLRMSNTEPLLRLNVESRNDKHLMEDKTAEISDFIASQTGAL